MTTRSPSYATVVLDVDSTISGIEGIDWLAERRGTAVARKVAELTDEAMRGVIPLESVYGARLDAIRPDRSDADDLSRAYVERLAPGCHDAVQRMTAAGVRVIMVSGGLRYALLPLASALKIDPADLHAVDIHFDSSGAYAGFDATSPLTTSDGKRRLLENLDVPRPILAVGDGSTDLAMRGTADRFAAFTGFVTRPSVVEQADVVIRSFEELEAMVLKLQDAK